MPGVKPRFAGENSLLFPKAGAFSRGIALLSEGDPGPEEQQYGKTTPSGQKCLISHHKGS